MLVSASVAVNAVPPPPVQVTADCETPTFASDTLVCEEPVLRELDNRLASYIAMHRAKQPGSAESDQSWFAHSRLCAFEPDHRDCLLAAYCLRLAFLERHENGQHSTCSPAAADYTAASSIVKSGFARSAKAIEKMAGREIAIWGYVDHKNLYGDDDARQILGDWWGGYSPDPGGWQFRLKAKSDDAAGQSFAVNLPNDLLRDDWLRLFVADARNGRPTQVYLKGTLKTFAAPTNTRALPGLSMSLRSSREIRLGLIK